MSDAHALAIKHSLRCFFNSYVRDMNPSFNKTDSTFVIDLNGKELKVFVSDFSLMGVHDYSGKFLFNERDVSFEEAAKILCGEDSKLFSRLLNSIHNMEQTFKTKRSSQSGNFISSEQSLLVGHNFHPTPKSRDEFSDEDFQKYSPEFEASFRINWVLVSREILWQETSHAFESCDWQKEIYPYQVPVGFAAYPLHPWQKEVLFKSSLIQSYLSKGLIKEGESTETKWFATSSMRSLYAPGAPYMLKFSMSVRLTNSIRHMQVNEVVRGMQVQDAFMTASGKEFSNRFPDFHVMHEPACMGIKDGAGDVLPETIVLVRENPFLHHSDEAIVLATLTQDHPVEGMMLMKKGVQKHSPERWFSYFLESVVVPLIVAQADYGIMLGAHQQNLVIAMKNDLPVGSWFRDCQGTGFSELGVNLMVNEMPDREKFLKHVVPTDMAKVLFSYYLVINSVMNTIHSVAKVGHASESELADMFSQRLLELRKTVKDTSVIDYLLGAPELKQKGNFRCSILGMNENTTDSPLSIYNTFKNPFYMESFA